MSRSRFAIWNYLSGVLFTVVTLLGLVVTRYLVAWLGESRFGAARTVADLLGYFTIFEVGLGATLAPLLARALESRDSNALAATVAGGMRSFVGLLLVSLTMALVMLPIVTWLIPVDPSDRVDLRLAWVVGTIGLIPVILSPFRSLADARQHGYRINLALTGQSLLIFGLSLLFARVGGGIAGQVAATTIATVPLGLFLARDAIRTHPGMLRSAVTVRPDPQVWTAIVGLGVPTLLITLSGRVSVLTDNLIVGKILGTAFAARLILSQRLAILAQSQLQAVGNACWAALAELHYQGRRDDFNRRLVELTRLVTILGVAALGPIVAYNRHFVALWVGLDHYLGDLIILVAAINALAIGLTSLWFWCFSGTGQVGRMLPVTVSAAALNLAASIALTSLMGAIGPLLGTTLSVCGLSLWYLPIALRRTFGTSAIRLALAVIGPLLLGLPFGLALQAISRSHTPAGWIGLGTEMSLAAATYLVIAATTLLGPAERAVWWRRLSGAFARRGDAPVPDLDPAFKSD